MQTSRQIVWVVVIALLIGAASLALIFLSPFKNTNWGKVSTVPSQTITVTGDAKSQQKNQIAHFTAGVNSVNDNKDTAVQEVNQKMQTLTDSIKTFGVAPEDMQTQNMSVYQGEESYYDSNSNTQKSRPGQWRVSNTVDIKLRNIDQVSQFTDLLSKSGATNVYGPDFSLEDTDQVSQDLLQKAITNAQQKAQVMAQSSGHQLGQVLSITEGANYSSGYPVPLAGGMGGGGGAPISQGSTTVQKSVTVVFELK